MKLGSSKLKQRARLQRTAPSNDWFKNVIKSVGYASSDIIKETIPSTFEFVESNGNDALDLYKQLREDGPKPVTKMMSDGVEKNQYIKIAKEAVSNIKEDLKSGKIYNKEREERAVIGDEDFSFDDDEDFSFGNDDDDFETEATDGSVTNVKRVTVNNINANISKNNPMVQSLQKHSEMMVGLSEASNKTNIALASTSYTLTSRVASDLMTGFGSVNDNLSALVNFNNDSMSKYVAASLQYYEDSLDVLKQTLESNTRPTLDPKQAVEEPDIFLGSGGLNVQNYLGRVKKNVKTTIESDLTLNSIYGMVSDTDTMKMLAANPLKAIPMAISKIIVPGVIRESAKHFDESFSAFFPAMLQKFNRMANQDGNWLMKTIGQIFGYNPKTSSTVELDKYHKGDMNFNGITQKAITEVIPTYLRKILSAVSGSNEMLFDYQKGKFIDYMQAKDEVKKEDRQAAFSSMEMYNELKNRLSAIEFTDESYKKDMLNEFDNLMFKLARSSGGVNPNVRKGRNGETIDEFRDMFNGEFTEIFRSAILSLNSSEQMKLMGSDIFNAKTSYGKRIDEIQNDIGASLLPILEAWDSSSDYKKDSKTGAYARKDPLGHITKDKFGKTSLDYLREVRNILLEGVITYPDGGSGRRGSGRVPSGGGGKPSTDIYSKRKKRLGDIEEENTRQTVLEQDANTRVIKTYSDSDIKKKQSKGVKVARSTSDLVADMTNDQMVDMFKNYVQIRDADEEADNQQKNAGNWIHKMLSKGGKKVQNARDFFDNVLTLPGRVVSNVLNELDGGLYKLVFGVNQDGSDRSFLSRVTTSIQESFGGFFDWTKEKFFKPINEALFGEEGFFTKIKNSEAMKKLKDYGNKMADWAFGNVDETGHRRNGAFSDAFNEVADMGREVGSVFTGKEFTDRNGNVHTANSNSVFGNVNAFTSEVLQNARTYLFGNRQKPSAERTAPQSFEQMSIDDYMSSVSKQDQEQTHSTSSTNEQMDLFGQMGNGGNSIVGNVMSWLKDNLQLQYRVDTDSSKGETKTIPFGQSVNEESAKGGFVPTMVNGFPYFSQRDPRYANYSYNLSTGKGGGDGLAFGDRGCGPTALAMVASGMGVDADPIDMANMATETGYSVEGGTKGSFFSSIGDKLGLNVKEKQTDESKVNSAIRDGKPVIFRGRKTTDKMTPFTNEGHFVVGVGGKDGKININDPNGMMTSGQYDVKDIVSESNKMWTFDDTGKGPDTNVTTIKTTVPNSVNTQPNLGIGNWVREASRDGSNEIKGVFGELAEGFYSAGHDMINLAFGNRESDEDDETKAKKFSSKFREMLPKGLAGGIIGGGMGTIVAATGGMGILGSMFLPGGPIGAAVLGTAVGFASQSEKFKSWLFGEKDPEDTSKRLGGFISENTQKFIKDNKATIIGGGAIGGLKGMLAGAGLLPSLLFGGPLTGAIMGAGIGLAVRSEKFQNMVFGKEDPETGKKIGGMLSKSYNSITDNKKQIGGAGIGLLGGAAAGTVLSSMGILGSAFFLGPVGGAIAGAGLGIAAASDKWRDKVFGTMDDGTNKREGGLIQEFQSGLMHNVLTPLKDAAKETAADMKFWFQEKVMLPIADLFGPFKTAIGMIAEDVMYKVSDIADSVKFTFNKFIAEPIGSFLKEKIFDKLVDVSQVMVKGFTGLVKTIAGSPFKLLDLTLNKMGAGIVQRKTRKRRDKYESAMTQLSELEDRRNQNLLSVKEERKYQKLRKTEARYYSDAYDQDKLNAKDNFKEIRARRVGEIRQEKEARMGELAEERKQHKNERRFNSIFGSNVDYDENLLNEYESIFLRDNGKKLKGRKNKKLAREEAAKFALRYKEDKIKSKDVSVEVKDIRDNIKDNLTPIRKSLYGLQETASAIAKSLGAKVSDKTYDARAGAMQLAAKLPGNKRKQQKADQLVKTTLNDMRASDERDAYTQRVGDGLDVRAKFGDAFKTSYASEERKAQLKAKYRSGEGSGGHKDPSWLMYGKGDKEKTESHNDPKKAKKGGFLASLGSSMFGALKRPDTVNGKEEEEKARKKEIKTKLAEKQKDVSSKNYSALKEQLIAKNKEAEERSWKESLLNAVTGIKEKTLEHTKNWSSIFSKKGLITAGLLLALPKILDFLKDPAKFVKDAITNLISNIKISIDWLFGKGNESRTDADGETIRNSGLEDSTARLTRNGIFEATKYLTKDGTVGNKVAKTTARIGRSIYNTGKEFAQHLTVGEGTREIIKAGYKGADRLVELGVRNADDLVELGVKNTKDLAALGLKSSDDLLKVGIRTGDDIAKFGVDLSTNKASKQLSKVGLKVTDELIETGTLKAGAKTTLKQTAGNAVSAVSKVANTSVSTVVDAGKKSMNNKFIDAVTGWFKQVFTSKAVTKELGEKASKKVLKEMTEKVTKAFSETILSKYALKISKAIAKTSGRVAGAAASLGILTVAFGVADFISGAVNTERLFEIPAGTATWEMKTISALLQTALGIGMVGPIIDVANEIIAEVTGLNLLSMIAVNMYKALVDDEKAVELSNLQSELDAAYAAYKEVNGLDDMSKRAYIDKTNPSMGTKIWDGTKKLGNTLTGNVFNTKKIRQTLGKEDGEKVTITDRASQLTGSTLGALSFGLADSDKITQSVAGGLDSAKAWTANTWNSAKTWGADVWNDTKTKASNAWDKTKVLAKDTGHELTGNVFNDNEIRRQLGLNDNVQVNLRDRISMGASSLLEKLSFGTLESENTIKKIQGIQLSIEETATDIWNSTKKSVSDFYNDKKNKFDFAKTAAGMFITGSLGLMDDEGRPLQFGEGMSILKSKAMTSIKNGISEVKESSSIFWEETRAGLNDWYNSTKDNMAKGFDAKNKEFGAFFGFKDDKGDDLSLTGGIALGTTKVVKGISKKVTSVTDTVSSFWKEANDILSSGLKIISDAIKGIPDAINKFFGGLVGFKDVSGEPMKLTEGIKQGWSTVTEKVSSWLNNKDDKATEYANVRNTAAEISVTTNGNGGYGGFGETMPQNIGARGCGPTAMAMVTSRITGSAIDPVAMSNLATQGGFAGNYGTNGAYFNYAANQFGISSTESKTTSENLTKALSSGEPVILRGQSNGEKDSAFTRAGHYVVAVGAKDGKVIINDPRGEQYSGAYNMSDVVNQSNVMWSFGNARGAYNRGDSIVFGGASTDTIPGELIVQYALIHKGKPYVWGANGPNSFDCSGLVNYVCKQAGLRLPSGRPTAEIWRKKTTPISKNDLKVGDLGFLVKNGKATHVGIYAGDGLWCHAEGGPGEKGAGGSVVLNARTYWTHYGRIPGVSGNTTAYSETSGVSSLAFNGGNTRTTSLLSNLSGYLSDVFTNGMNSAMTGQVGSFQTYSDYIASNMSSDSTTSNTNYTDTIGTVSLGSRKTTAELLNKSLSGRLADKGSTIVSIGNKYGVDPAFLAAVLHHESGNGTSSAIINRNNPGGIMDASTGWSTLKSFSTLDEGIEYTASNLKKNYLEQGLTTISKIGAKYAPVGAANDPRSLNNYWTSNVSTLYNKYSSDTGYGGFGDGFAPVSNISTFGSFGEASTQVSGTNTGFNFGDKMSQFGGMGDYIRTQPTQIDFTNDDSDDKVVGVMETMVEVLKTIAENTGATNSNIREAMSTAINKISNSSSNVSVNNVTTNGNKTITTSSNYSAKETANRSIAERIAAGKFA